MDPFLQADYLSTAHFCPACAPAQAQAYPRALSRVKDCPWPAEWARQMKLASISRANTSAELVPNRSVREKIFKKKQKTKKTTTKTNHQYQKLLEARDS